MLNTEAPFPYAGARAVLRASADHPEPQPCRILQRRGDGRVTIALTGHSFRAGHPDAARRASGNRTVELADLAATAEEATPPAARAAVAAPNPPRARSGRGTARRAVEGNRKARRA